MSYIALCIIPEDDVVSFENTAYSQQIPVEHRALQALMEQGSEFPSWFLDEQGNHRVFEDFDDDGNPIEANEPVCLDPETALAEMKKTHLLVSSLDVSLFDAPTEKEAFVSEFDELLRVVEEAVAKKARFWISAADE